MVRFPEYSAPGSPRTLMVPQDHAKIPTSQQRKRSARGHCLTQVSYKALVSSQPMVSGKHWQFKSLAGSPLPQHRLINVRPREIVFVPTVGVANVILDWAVALPWILLTPISMDQPTRARGSLGHPTSRFQHNSKSQTHRWVKTNLCLLLLLLPRLGKSQTAMRSHKGSDGMVPKVSTLLCYNLFFCMQQSRPEIWTWSSV